LHGDMNQMQRNKVIKRFKNKEFSILVATDVAARGIDVSDVTHVINFSFPEDHEGYVHRIGRTGRAGKKGIAITFISRTELRLITMLKRKFNMDVKPIDVPTTKEIMQVRVEQAQEYLKSLNIEDIFEHNIMKELHTLVQGIPQEQLVKVVVKLLHKTYFKEKENGVSFASSKDVSLDAADHELQEIYLNVGSDDGLTKSDILDFVEKHAKVPADQSQKVKLLKRRCYLVSTGKVITDLIGKVRGKKLGGRKVIAFMSDDYQPQRPQQRRKGRHSSGRMRRGGRSKSRK
jgi:ATP-dependent RNA helicase DeaD